MLTWYGRKEEACAGCAALGYTWVSGLVATSMWESLTTIGGNASVTPWAISWARGRGKVANGLRTSVVCETLSCSWVINIVATNTRRPNLPLRSRPVLGRIVRELDGPEDTG